MNTPLVYISVIKLSNKDVSEKLKQLV